MRLEVLLVVLASSLALAAPKNPAKKAPVANNDEGPEIPTSCPGSNGKYAGALDCYLDLKVFDNTLCGKAKYGCTNYDRVGADAGMELKVNQNRDFAEKIPPSSAYYTTYHKDSAQGEASAPTEPGSSNQRQSVKVGAPKPLDGKVHHKVHAGQ
ncbi:MAG: hypothetical protein M1829_000994 [Trizodia sp. TS-e1964]|nr:MAG: hypothetical protein M1829_000994 [Trizodia sp. TS-e1964]